MANATSSPPATLGRGIFLNAGKMIVIEGNYIGTNANGTGAVGNLTGIANQQRDQ